ncbi:aromatic-rich family protein [Yoonia vestfoldensis SKA53]|uniref:Aromatic-rich family protein n=2 Tax=Paracoccaceae TaxID=31989 RepID=A3V674_9RHOB|nr:aromatic-rich family protein [Yoonia vestfoldensis SKA53]
MQAATIHTVALWSKALETGGVLADIAHERGQTMPQHSETRVLPFSADQMYALVGDVAHYPKFLPWTAAARIRDTKDHGDHLVMLADLVISFKVFRETFGSKVTLWPATKRIDTAYLDGPFKHMESQWNFRDVEGGCEVSFFVDFEFRNRLLQGAAGMFFNEAMQRIVRAFERRAQELYGVSAANNAPSA